MMVRFLEGMNRVLVRIGMWAIVVMMSVVSLNVIGRALFRFPIFGTVEIVELAGAIFVSCILAYTQLQRENITVNALIERLSPRLQAMTNCFTQFLNLVIIAALAWTGAVRALEMLRAGEITAIFRIPQYPFRFVWVFGCIALFVVLVSQFIESLVKVIKK